MSQLLLIFTMTYFRTISRTSKGLIEQITYFLAPCIVLFSSEDPIVLFLFFLFFFTLQVPHPKL